jgi:hypothetical protein
MTTSVDYTSKDFAGFKQSLLDYAAHNFPQWTSRSEGDFGVLLVEQMAYLADILSYYGDRIAAEAFLPTATQRLSLLYLADLLGYTPSNGTPATGTVVLQTANPGPAVVVPAGTQVSTPYIGQYDGPIIYETNATVTVPANGGQATVYVTEGITYTDINIGTSSGLANQAFRIPYTPVIDGSVSVEVEDATGSTFPWVYMQHLIDSEFSDFVFTTYSDDQGSTWVQFGDGVNGAIPSNGLTITATFRVGGGVRGNVAAQTINNIVTENLSGVYIATNPDGTPQSSAMTGGTDPESNDQIRSNAPQAFQTQNRAVTLDDYAALALGVGAVAKASAVANHYSSVTVYIAAAGITAPSSTLINQVTAAIQPKAMAGTTVTVSGPVSITPVDFGSAGNPVILAVQPRFSQAQVQLNVTQAFQALFNPENVDFGMRLALSDVYAAVSAVPGVAYIQIPVMIPHGGTPGNSDILFRPGEIPSFGTLTMNVTGGVF